jgi:hypothetical protein
MALDILNTGETGTYTVTLKDEAGVAVPLANVSTITLTLRHRFSGDIINTRSAQDVKNTNNCTFHATSGLFTWYLQPGDTPLTDATRKIDEHLGLITITYTGTGGTRVAAHEVVIRVRNTSTVPVA